MAGYTASDAAIFPVADRLACALLREARLLVLRRQQTQGLDQCLAFIRIADADAQVLVDARMIKVAHDNRTFTQSGCQLACRQGSVAGKDEVGRRWQD